MSAPGSPDSSDSSGSTESPCFSYQTPIPSHLKPSAIYTPNSSQSRGASYSSQTLNTTNKQKQNSRANSKLSNTQNPYKPIEFRQRILSSRSKEEITGPSVLLESPNALLSKSSQPNPAANTQQSVLSNKPPKSKQTSSQHSDWSDSDKAAKASASNTSRKKSTQSRGSNSSIGSNSSRTFVDNISETVLKNAKANLRPSLSHKKHLKSEPLATSSPLATQSKSANLEQSVLPENTSQLKTAQPVGAENFLRSKTPTPPEFFTFSASDMRIASQSEASNASYQKIKVLKKSKSKSKSKSDLPEQQSVLIDTSQQQQAAKTDAPTTSLLRKSNSEQSVLLDSKKSSHSAQPAAEQSISKLSIINEIILCKICGKKLVNPHILLCCNNTVCLEHIDEQKKPIQTNEFYKYKCCLCDVEKNPLEFPRNALLEKLFEYRFDELDYGEEFERCKLKCEELNDMMRDCLELLNNPENFIEQSYEDNVKKIVENKEHIRLEFQKLCQQFFLRLMKTEEICIGASHEIVVKYKNIYRNIKSEFDVEQRLEDFELFSINKEKCNKYYEHASAQTNYMKNLIRDIRRDLVLDYYLPSEKFDVERFKKEIEHKFALEKR